MLPTALRDLARRILPTCRTLTEAETALGGLWHEGNCDHAARATTWGLFDGFHGRPATASIKGQEARYTEAYRTGQSLTV